MTMSASTAAGRSDDVGPARDARWPEARRDRIGWWRAIASGVAIVLVGFVGAVLVPDKVLGSGSGSRDTLAFIASTIAVLVVALLAWALRRLQARGLI